MAIFFEPQSHWPARQFGLSSSRPDKALERRRCAKPNGFGAHAAAVSPTVRDSGVEVDAVAGLEMMPHAANLNLDSSLEYDDAILSLMGKQRTAFRAGRSFDPQEGRTTAHIGRQQFVMDAGAWKRELLSLRPADNGYRRVGLTRVFQHELSRGNTEHFRQAAERVDRRRQQVSFDLAEIADRESRPLRKVEQGHVLLLAMGANGVAKGALWLAHRNTLGFGRRRFPQLHTPTFADEPCLSNPLILVKPSGLSLRPHRPKMPKRLL
jgi:hypothetical protein